MVDDHQDTCLGMKMLLERRGYRITLAHTADQAIEKAQAEKFDLLISDIGLPDRSGYELMKELRAKNALRGIALSGFGMENDINQARAAGFSEHLTKPINFDRLDEAIRNLLVEDRRTQASRFRQPRIHQAANDMEQKFMRFLNSRRRLAPHQELDFRHSFRRSAVPAEQCHRR